ncbi:MAG: hypothetical protein MZV64_48475 [Ignavibacteriales bacterium]|nr:hypothetical protein [Ignavibacteriales bacterium]
MIYGKLLQTNLCGINPQQHILHVAAEKVSIQKNHSLCLLGFLPLTDMQFLIFLFNRNPLLKEKFITNEIPVQFIASLTIFHPENEKYADDLKNVVQVQSFSSGDSISERNFVLPDSRTTRLMHPCCRKA